MHQALGQKSESVKGHLSSSTYNAENFYRSSLFCIPLSISPFRPPKPMCALCSQGEILRREGVFNTPNGAWTWRWSVRDDVKKQMEWYTLVTGGDNGVSDAYLGPRLGFCHSGVDKCPCHLSSTGSLLLRIDQRPQK